MARFKVTDRPIIPTPFYFYDMDLLKETLETACKEAGKYGFHIHFAVKANSEPRILRDISSHGIGADCVSGWEVKRSLECGFKPSCVAFAGVGKTDAEIEYALEKGIFLLNIESIEELEVVGQIASKMGVKADIALRVNPDIAPDTSHLISTGHSDSKFGITRSELHMAAQKAMQSESLNLKGIHIHIGSQITDMRFFEYEARVATGIIADLESIGCPIDIIDLGGGLGVDYQNPDKNPVPDFSGYFAAFDKYLHGKNVHVELGRALVAQCGELVTKVLYTKNAGEGKKYIITDAGMTDLIRPALYGAKHKIENLSASGRREGVYSIGGPVCESTDIFADGIIFPESQRGDILTIRSAGAYGSIMSSHYNLRPFAAAIYSDEFSKMA